MKTTVNRKHQTTNVPHRIMRGMLVAATLLCLSPHVCAAATGGPALPADAIQSYVPSAIRRGAPFSPENPIPHTPSEAIEEALRSGDPDKLYRAALFAENSPGLHPDWDKISSLYEKAAEAGHPDARVRGIWISAWKSPEDMDAAITALSSAGLADASTASHSLALLLIARDNGRAQEGVALVRDLAGAGDPDAIFTLAALHQEGRFLPKDEEKAFDLYSKAAALGHPAANLNLGICYMHGIGTPQMPERAVQFYLVAAGAGDFDAMHNLGNAYANGRGVPKDLEKAVFWFRKSADAGNAESLAACALFQLTQQKLSPMEGERALRDLRRAADLGNALANFAIGAGILEGKITHKDPAQAYRRLLVAAEAGMPEAQYLLSGILFTGVPSGLLPNRAEAVKWALLCQGMNSESSRKLLKNTLESSSPGDIEEGRKRAAEFQPESRDKTMGRRMGFRYHRSPQPAADGL